MKILVLAVLAFPILLIGCAGQVPELGINNDKLAPCPQTPNCVNSQAVGEKQHIQPIRYQGTVKEARAHLLQILDSLKRTKILNAKEDYIRVEFSSAFFRFVDDVEFYFHDEESEDAIIHVRSASRIGRSDFGVNRKRIEMIRSQIQE